jgi:acyl-CoA thioesterase I
MIRMLLFSGMLLPAALAAGTPAPADSPAIVVLGDSLSAAYGIPTDRGWVSLLEARLVAAGPGYRVVNASISGDTTGGGLTRLPEILERHRPAVVVVALGANDGLRGIAIREIEDNLKALVRLVRGAGAAVLLVGVRLPPNYGAAYTEGFQGSLRRVAEAEQVALVPDLLAGVAEDWHLMQADGLHPTAEAQPRILDNVWPGLEALLVAQPEPASREPLAPGL